MKRMILLFLIVILMASCSATKNYLPFAKNGKYGKYPTKKNKPVKNQYSWIERQWKGEGR